MLVVTYTLEDLMKLKLILIFLFMIGIFLQQFLNEWNWLAIQVLDSRILNTHEGFTGNTASKNDLARC